MGVNVIDPRGMDIVSWADAMVLNLEQFGNIGRLDSEDGWRLWASELSTMRALSGTTVPDPYVFSRWNEWAESFVKNLAGVA